MLDQVRGYSDDDITALSLKFYERAVQAGTVAPVGPDAESLSLQGGEAAGEESQEGGEESGGAQSDDLSSGVEMEGGEAASWAGRAVHSWGEMIPNYGECCDVSGLSLHVGEKGTGPALRNLHHVDLFAQLQVSPVLPRGCLLLSYSCVEQQEGPACGGGGLLRRAGALCPRRVGGGAGALRAQAKGAAGQRAAGFGRHGAAQADGLRSE